MDVLEQPHRGLAWPVHYWFLNFAIYLKCLAVQPSAPVKVAFNLGKSSNCMSEERNLYMHMFCIFCINSA